MAQHQFLPSHCKAKENVVLISLNRCGMVGVGLRASLKGENQIWSEKKNTFILSNYNELVEILGSEMETSCGAKATRSKIQKCSVTQTTNIQNNSLLEARLMKCQI